MPLQGIMSLEAVSQVRIEEVGLECEEIKWEGPSLLDAEDVSVTTVPPQRPALRSSFTQVIGLEERAKYSRLEKQTYFFVCWIQRRGFLLPACLSFCSLIIWCWGLAVVQVIDENQELTTRWLEDGSLLAQNAEYTRKYDPRWGRMLNWNYVIFSEHDRSNILTRQRLEQSLEIIKELVAQEVLLFGRIWGWNDLCARPSIADELQRQIEARKLNVSDSLGFVDYQCSRRMPADCFFEGGFDRPPYMDSLHGPTAAGGLPRIQDFSSDVDIGLAFANGCPNNFDGSWNYNSKFFTGGAEYYGSADGCNLTRVVKKDGGRSDVTWTTGESCVRRAELLEAAFLMPSDEDLRDSNWRTAAGELILLSEDDAKDLKSKFLGKWLAVLQREKRFRAEMISTAMIENFVEALSDAPKKHLFAGLSAMFLVCCVAHMNFRPCGTGLSTQVALGLLIVIMSTLTGVGLIGLLLGRVDPPVVQVVPFFALGIGVDDMLVYIHHFLHTGRESLSAEEFVGKAITRSWASVTTTTLSNGALFAVAWFTIRVPLVRTTCLSLIICEVVNYVWLMLGMPFLLYWTARTYDQQDQACMEANAAFERKRTLGDLERAEPAWKSVQGAWSLAALVVKPAGDTLAKRSDTMLQCLLSVHKSTRSKLLLLVLLAGLCCAAIWQLQHTTIPFGIPPLDTVPRYPSDDLYEGAQLWQDYVDQGYYFVYMKDLAYAEPQMQINSLRFFDKLNNGDLNSSCVFWLPFMTTWAQQYRDDSCTIVCVNDGGRILKQSACGNSSLGLDQLIVKEDQFYKTFSAFVSPLNKTAEESWTSSTATAPAFDWQKFPLDPSGAFSLTWSHCVMESPVGEPTFSVYGGGQWWVGASARLHAFMETFPGAQVGSVYAEGFLPTTLASQVKMKEKLPRIAAYACLVVFVVGSIATWSLVAGIVMVLVASISALEIFGLLYFLRLEFNFFVALCLLVTIGLSIDLTAHILVAIEWADGTPSERAAEGVRRTFFPVVLGAVSSLVGVLPMLWHYIGYIEKYFGLLLLVAIIVCLVNSVIFLPILYSLVFIPVYAAWGWLGGKVRCFAACKSGRCVGKIDLKIMTSSLPSVPAFGPVAPKLCASFRHFLAVRSRRPFRLYPALALSASALHLCLTIVCLSMMILASSTTPLAGSTPLPPLTRIDFVWAVTVHGGLAILTIPGVLLYFWVGSTEGRPVLLHLNGIFILHLHVTNCLVTFEYFLALKGLPRFWLLLDAAKWFVQMIATPLLFQIIACKLTAIQEFPPGFRSPLTWGFMLSVCSVLVMGLQSFRSFVMFAVFKTDDFVDLLNLAALKFDRMDESLGVRALWISSPFVSLLYSLSGCALCGFMYHTRIAILSILSDLAGRESTCRAVATAHSAMRTHAIAISLCLVTSLVRCCHWTIFITMNMATEMGDRWDPDKNIYAYKCGWYISYLLDEFCNFMSSVILSNIVGIFVRSRAPSLSEKLGLSTEVGDVVETLARTTRLARLDEARASVAKRFGYNLAGLDTDKVEFALHRSVSAYRCAWFEHADEEPLALIELTNPTLGSSEGGPAASVPMTMLGLPEELQQPQNDIDQLLRNASKAQRFLKERLASGSKWAAQERLPHERHVLTGSTGGWEEGLHPWLDTVTDPGVKSRARALEKARFKYHTRGGAARVRDLARLALQFDSAERLIKAVRPVSDLFNVLVFENRFANPTALGWADITLLVRVPIEGSSAATDYHISELQLQLRAFAVAREGAHQHYGDLRELLPEAGVLPQDLDAVLSEIMSVMDT